MTNVPTHLICRHGIFYFQYRLSQKSAYIGRYKKSLIRKSTHTGCRRRALEIAAIWKGELLMGRKLSSVEELRLLDGVDAEQLSLGKQVALRIAERHPLDYDGIELLMAGLSQVERTAYDAWCVYTGQTADDLRECNAHVVSNEADRAVEKSEPLSFYIKDYMDFRARQKPMSQSAIGKANRAFDVLLELTGDKAASALTLEDVEHFVDILIQLPRNYSKSKKYYSGNGERLPLEEIIAIAARDGDPLIRLKTVKDYTSFVKPFFKRAAKRRYVDPIVREGFENLDVMKIDPDDRIKAKPFDEGHLPLIFSSDRFAPEMFRDKPERFWMPIFCALMGVRRGEIARLYCSEVTRDSDTGIWYMDIVHDPENKRTVKTESSRRQVPVHPDLLRLGFLRFLKQQRECGYVQLFPNLKPNNDEDWGDEVSTWFNNKGHLRKCGVVAEEGTRLSFHSFRHTFINYGKQNFLNTAVRDEITGHSAGTRKTNASGDYEQVFGLQAKLDYLSQVSFHLPEIEPW